METTSPLNAEAFKGELLNLVQNGDINGKLPQGVQSIQQEGQYISTVGSDGYNYISIQVNQTEGYDYLAIGHKNTIAVHIEGMRAEQRIGLGLDTDALTLVFDKDTLSLLYITGIITDGDENERTLDIRLPNSPDKQTLYRASQSRINHRPSMFDTHEPKSEWTQSIPDIDCARLARLVNVVFGTNSTREFVLD